MSYRLASRPEFVEALGDLTALKRWRQHVWLTRALYGLHATRIVVTAEWRDVILEVGHEMDEPCVEAYISRVAVYDERGGPLAPDLRLPQWQERLAQPDMTLLIGAARETAIAQVVQAAYTWLGVVAAGSTTYRMNTSPKPHWPSLYVGGGGRPYRPASEAEMELATWDVGVANTWDFFTRFARDVYGPRAARIDVTGKWMEQDPDAWPMHDQKAMARAVAVMVADASGTALAPDPTTSWWQEWCVQQEVVTMREEERAAAMAEAVQAYQSAWPFTKSEQETYWMGSPPARRGPILFVREPFEPL
jgi:hypothetical protein